MRSREEEHVLSRNSIESRELPQGVQDRGASVKTANSQAWQRLGHVRNKPPLQIPLSKRTGRPFPCTLQLSGALGDGSKLDFLPVQNWTASLEGEMAQNRRPNVGERMLNDPELSVWMVNDDDGLVEGR